MRSTVRSGPARLVLAAALLVLPLLLPTAVAANCLGPSITVAPASGPPGTTFRITGTGFGTDCYDTGPPPPGQGGLGEPQTGIEVSLTDAGSTRTVLATVDAGPQYRFSIEVTVPVSAAVGTATVGAHSADVYIAQAAFELLGDPAVVPDGPHCTD